MTLSAGSRLGPYQIVAVLGSGGMGEVYEANDPRLRRRVALKILPEAVARDTLRRERFEREARTIAALSHPHIVTIDSVEEAEGVQFLTMELVKGRRLGSLIPPGGLPLVRLLQMWTSTCRILMSVPTSGWRDPAAPHPLSAQFAPPFGPR